MYCCYRQFNCFTLKTVYTLQIGSEISPTFKLKMCSKMFFFSVCQTHRYVQLFVWFLGKTERQKHLNGWWFVVGRMWMPASTWNSVSRIEEIVFKVKMKSLEATQVNCCHWLKWAEKEILRLAEVVCVCVSSLFGGKQIDNRRGNKHSTGRFET